MGTRDLDPIAVEELKAARSKECERPTRVSIPFSIRRKKRRLWSKSGLKVKMVEK